MSNSTAALPEWLSDFCANDKWANSLDDLSLTGATPCFEGIVIRGAVNVATAVLLIVRFVQLCKATKLSFHIEATWVYWLKIWAAVVNVAVPALTLNGLIASSSWAPFEMLTLPLTAFNWILLLVAIHLESSRYSRRAPKQGNKASIVPKQKQKQPSHTHRWAPSGRWILLFLFLFVLAADVVRLRTQLVLAQAQSLYFFVMYVIGFAHLCALVLVAYLYRPNDFHMVQKLKLHESPETLQRELAQEQDDSHTADKLITPSHRSLSIASSAEAQAVRAAALAAKSGKQALHDDEDADANVDVADGLGNMRTPEESAMIWSRATFSWLTPLIKAGYKQPLQLSHLWRLNPKQRTKVVGAKFQRCWNAEIARNPSNPSMVRAFHKAFGPYFYRAGIWMLIQNICQYAPPLLLREMILYIQSRGSGSGTDHSNDLKGYLLAGLMFLFLMAMTLAENRYRQTHT